MIDERGIQLAVEDEEEPTKESDVFYNDEMTLNRDISVAALQTFRDNIDRDIRVLDALAGSGVRALRYGKEVDGIGSITANDMKPEAAENIRANVARNDMDGIEVTEQDANLLLTERRKGFDYIDLDPFGSPARFTDSMVRGLYHDGFVGVTATDLGTLCGTYRKTCRRRYGSWSLNTSYCHEIGIRVLLKFLFESFARFDYVFRPQVSVAQKHYYRICGRVRESKKGVNRQLDNIGYLLHCDDCSYRTFTEEPAATECRICGNDLHVLGPLWTGHLGNQEFCEDATAFLDDAGYEEARELLGQFGKEAPIKTPYYDTHRLAETLDMPVPSRDAVIESLRETGYNAERTHFAATGLRTNCPFDDLRDAMRSV